MSTQNTQANPNDLLKSSLSSLANMQPSDREEAAVANNQQTDNSFAEYDPLKPNQSKQSASAPAIAILATNKTELNSNKAAVSQPNKSLSGRFAKTATQSVVKQSAPVESVPVGVDISNKAVASAISLTGSVERPTSIRQMAKANVAQKEVANAAGVQLQNNVKALSSLSNGQVKQDSLPASTVKQGRFAKVPKPELSESIVSNVSPIKQQSDATKETEVPARMVTPVLSEHKVNSTVATGRFGNQAKQVKQSNDNVSQNATNVSQSATTTSQPPKQEKAAGGLRGLKEAAAKKEEQGMITGTDVRIKLNTMRTYSPLIDVIKKHDPLMSDDEFESVFSMLEQEVDKLTTNLCEVNGIDRYDETLQWAVASVKKTAVEHVANQWKGNRNAAKFSMDGYLDAYKIALELDAVSHEVEVYPRTTFETKIKLSMMKALTPVIYEYSLFENVVGSMHPEFKLNREELCDKTSDWLMESALSLCEDLNVDPMDENMVTVFQSALNVCGENLSSSVASIGDRTLDKLERMDPSTRIVFIQNSVDKSLSLIDMEALKVDFQEKIDIVKNKTNKAPLFFATNRRAGIGR